MTRSAPKSSTRFAVLLAIALASPIAGVPRAHGEAAPILLDGTFADWTGPIEHVDPVDAQGVDLREFDLANDDAFLFVRFQTTLEVALQEGSDLILYLDTDLNAGTGLAVGGIGAELQWRFGDRSGCFYPAGSCIAIGQNALRLRMLPSITGSAFEIAIGRDVRPNGVNPLFTGPSFRILLVSTGDQDFAPDAGGLTYTFDSTPVPAPAPIPFARTNALDVRVVTWNTRDLESGSGYDASAAASTDRVLSAIAPDVVCFQEVYNTGAAQMRTLVEGMLPDRAPWYAAKQNDCAVVSRYPVVQSWTLDGNLAVLLDADAALDADLLLVCAHLPCCTNDAGRQNEIDRIMAFFRDAKTAGGIVNVPAGTALMIAGDLNLVGLSQQLRSLLTGDIVNQGTFGADFAPDWDGSGLADVVSSQTERRFAYTWRSDGSSYAPGRLDFVIFTDAVIGLRNHFAVYSAEMSASSLVATGIQAGDVANVSDHLPHVADFRSVEDLSNVGGVPPGRFELSPGTIVGRGEVRFELVLGADAAVAIALYDVRGRRVASVFDEGARSLAAGRHPLVWNGRGTDGRALPCGIYFVRADSRATSGSGSHWARGRWVLLR